MDRKTFIFYESYFNMGQQIEDKTVRCDFYESIVKAALKGEPLENTGNALIDMAYIGIRPLIEANIKNYQNGCKGGAPLGNGNAKKNNPKTTQKQPKTTEGQPYKDKDVYKDSNKDKNKDAYKDKDVDKDKDKDKEKKPSAISEEEEEFDIAEWEVPDDFFDEVDEAEDKGK
jgi:hypothetical protein